MDMEIFERALKDSKIDHPLNLDRAEFEKAFPNVAVKAGRSWWRIRVS